MGYLRDTWKKFVSPQPSVSARIIPTWKANKPLPSPTDIDLLAKEGYRGNALVAACIWAISTSACEPELIIKQRNRKTGKLELATSVEAEALRRLLARPNPEHTTFTFLEELFVHQQVSGMWFFRKLRAELGNRPAALWPLHPSKVEIVPDSNGWVKEYRFGKGSIVTPPIPAADVVRNSLHPNMESDFWGLSPITIASRYIDLDNSAGEFLRGFFANNGTPAGILKLKAKVEREERDKIKEIWKEQHTGVNANSVSVLDADADYEVIGTDAAKMKLDGVLNESEARICAAFGVPAIIAGAVIGLTRSTFANYAEARRSFWEDTLVPLYKRCAQALTEGLCHEFQRNADGSSDLVIEFDFNSVEALKENTEARREHAFTGWDSNVFTMNQVLSLLGMELLPDTDPIANCRKNELVTHVSLGDFRNSSDTGDGAIKPLVRKSGKDDEPDDDDEEDDDEDPKKRNVQLRVVARQHHKRRITADEKTALREFKKVATAHFNAQRKALLKHLQA